MPPTCTVIGFKGDPVTAVAWGRDLGLPNSQPAPVDEITPVGRTGPLRPTWKGASCAPFAGTCTIEAAPGAKLTASYPRRAG